MDTTILVQLAGQADPYRLDPPAHDRLAGYLDRAAARLGGDPDRDEVLGDLERSIGDRLARVGGPSGRIITAADIEAVLDAIGIVETGDAPEPELGELGDRPHPRRLQRIREGQKVAGVCAGLAAYAELNVDWVRTFFVLGTLVTAGILGLVYIAMAFILPIAPSRTRWRDRPQP